MSRYYDTPNLDSWNENLGLHIGNLIVQILSLALNVYYNQTESSSREMENSSPNA